VTGKILIVEDDRDLAENLAEILASRGYDPLVAPSAESALTLVERQAFDAIITDVKLPGLDGVSLIQKLRQTGAPMPVIVVSAFMDEGMTESAQEAGALEVLIKPVDLERLFGLLDALLAPHKRVLIVDDNVLLAENLAEALRERGIEPVLGADAESALASRALPRMALVDLRLPDQSGVEVARRLRARDPNVKILFITAHAEELNVRRGALEAILPGVDVDQACLVKPFDMARLIALVEAAVAGS
jgi:DNA-binding response OmpR family regulator